MTDYGVIIKAAQGELSMKNAAREQAFPLSRTAIRQCANAIRATHRGEFEAATELLAEARRLVYTMMTTLAEHPDILYAGFVGDAQKELAEAAITLAVIGGHDIPTPADLAIDWPPYLNGLGEAIGELRRHLLDELRRGHIPRSEALLIVMDDMLGVLMSLDFPDAITNNLRRTTDSARGIIEKTRGDLTLVAVQTQLAWQMQHISTQLGEGQVPVNGPSGDDVA